MHVNEEYVNGSFLCVKNSKLPVAEVISKADWLVASYTANQNRLYAHIKQS